MNSSFSSLLRLLIIATSSSQDTVITPYFKALVPRPSSWEIARCKTLEEGVSCLGARCFDILMIERPLLGPDPLATVAELRARFPTLALLVLALTEVDAAQSDSLFSAGVQDIIALPQLGVADFFHTVHGCRLRQRLTATQDRDHSTLQRRYDDQVGYLKGLIDKTRDGTVIIDQKGVVKFANNAALELFGRSAQQLIGSYFGYPLGSNQPLELTIKTASGLVTVEMRVTKIEWDNSVAFLASLRDVTRYKELAESSKSAEEAAQRASQQKSQFLATMSHEIRTPLNGLLGMARLVQETPLNAEQRDLICTIQSSGEILLQLISDILDLSKIEAGMIEFEHRGFRLRDVVEDTLGLYAQAALTKRLLVASVIAPDVPANLVGDKVRCRQIIGNVVSNAIKYTDSGRVVVRVRLEGREAGRCRLRFAVEDTGIGIAPGKFRELFQPFRQVSERASEGGTGLGLSITKRLVELMGGEIGCTSRLGEGSVFYFSLPFRCDDSVDAVGSVPLGVTPPTLLVVASSPQRRAVFVEQLRTAGCRTREAALASDFSANTDVDLVVVDTVQADDLARAVEFTARYGLPLLRIECDRSRQGAHAAATTPGFAIHVPVHHDQLIETVLSLIRHQGQTPPERVRSHSAPRKVPRCRPDKTLKLLIAEDNPVNQQVASRFLRLAGFEADLAVNGQEALDKIMANRYAAVLMDCRMPQMDGLQATRLIRALEPVSESRLPIIALTANAMPADRDECAAAGMDGFLAKPLRLDDLVSELERVLPMAFCRDDEVTDRSAATGPPDAAQADAAAAKPTALIDAALFDRFVASIGDAAFVAGAVQTLAQDGARCLSTVRSAVQAGDPTTAIDALHRLRGSCASLGAALLPERCAAWEQLVRNNAGQLIGLGEQVGSLTAIFDSTIVELQRRLGPAASAQEPGCRAQPMTSSTSAALQ